MTENECSCPNKWVCKLGGDADLADYLLDDLLLGGISIFLSAAWVVSTSDIYTLKDAAYALFISVTQGILSAGASVYFNQLYVQSKKKE